MQIMAEQVKTDRLSKEKDQAKREQIKAELDIKSLVLPPQKEYHLAQRTKIDKYFKNYKTVKYLYDFGDSWEHKITIEKVLDDYIGERCVVLKSKGDCPPEDVGGIGAYYDFLDTYNDKNNVEHNNIVEWADMQGYGEFDIDKCNKTLKEYMKVRKGK